MVMIWSTFFWTYGKMVSPGFFTAVPSAMVLALGKVTTWPASREAFIHAALAGSTPITVILGLSIFAKVDTPVIRPPPPTGTRIISTVGSSLIISIAMVPWPVATSKSLNGWTKVAPVSSAMRYAAAQASSKTSPSSTTSAPYPFVRLIFINGVVVGIQTVALIFASFDA